MCKMKKGRGGAYSRDGPSVEVVTDRTDSYNYIIMIEFPLSPIILSLEFTQIIVQWVGFDKLSAGICVGTYWKLCHSV